MSERTTTAGPPEQMREVPVFEHPADVRVKPEEQLVERLEVVYSDGDVGLLDIPAEPGEVFDETSFAKRRDRALFTLAQQLTPDDEDPRDSLPGILSRQYVLWIPSEPPSEGKTDAPVGPESSPARSWWQRVRGAKNG